jgi:phosphatidylglycerophosphatase GEP4
MDELAIVGDRIFTDVILANRMRWKCLRQPRSALQLNAGNGENPEKGKDSRENDTRLPLAIHTTGLWKREGSMMRWVENGMARMVERWTATEDRLRAKQELADKFIRSNVWS